jgi:hypothetical protein
MSTFHIPLLVCNIGHANEHIPYTSYRLQPSLSFILLLLSLFTSFSSNTMREIMGIQSLSINEQQQQQQQQQQQAPSSSSRREAFHGDSQFHEPTRSASPHPQANTHTHTPLSQSHNTHFSMDTYSRSMMNRKSVSPGRSAGLKPVPPLRLIAPSSSAPTPTNGHGHGPSSQLIYHSHFSGLQVRGKGV